MLYTDYTFPDTEVYDVDAINQSITNILLTRKGTLPGKPTFGSNCHKHLFSQMDHITESLLESDIIEAISEWEPRVLVRDVTVKSVPEYNKIIADLTFEYVDKGLIVNATTKIAFNNI